MKINASITMLCDRDNGVVIEIRDSDANTKFVNISMTSGQFVAALSRLANVRVESCDVIGLDRVGKVHENSTHVFEMPYSSYKDRYDVAEKEAKKTTPDGWVPDLYFGSQGSFFCKDGKDYARCTIRRWKEKQEAAQ